MELTLRQDYDYIIVGAGSAGATLCNRLSKDTRFRILLVEAGGEVVADSHVPFLARNLQKSTSAYKYFTEPQKQACLGLVEQRSHWPQGKCLGGSSAINFMMYVRGNKRDFDGWAQQGCEGWSYYDVLPYFIKSEDNRIPDVSLDYHGTDGELSVSTPEYSTVVAEAFLQGGKQLGYDVIDYNGSTQTGFGRNQATIRNGERCSSEMAFLRPIRSRTNLTILTKANVLKIAFDKDKRATSILVDHNGKTHPVSAKKEILICAGAIGSPKLLLLSGVGPKDHLQDLGIQLVINLPGVGCNLQDHIGIGCLHYRLKDAMTFSGKTTETEANRMEYTENMSGPLSVPAGVEGMAFINSSYVNPNDDYPDIQLTLTSNFAPLPNAQEKYKQDSVLEENGVLTLTPVLLRPKSRGYVKLKTRDPAEDPIIDPKYLSEEEDLAVLIEGGKLVQKLAKTKPFQDLGAEPVFLGNECSNLDLGDLARMFTRTIFHPVGTCKMGSVTDPLAVVDSQLRVIGAEGLRVVDSSIMPTIISGNTHATCVMIGEMAAEFIKFPQRQK